MGKIHLVTDSTSYLPPTIIEKFDIKIIPLRIIWGEETLREGVDITDMEFIGRLRQSKDVPSTSQPPAGEFEAVYRELGADGGTIISAHISGDLSGTIAAAEAARRMLPDLDIRVIDSRITCLGLGFMLWEAGEMRAAGRSADDIIARIEEMIQNSTAYFMVDDLNYLRRGGRIGTAQAVLGSLVQLKPILCVEDGQGVIEVAEKVRTQKKALSRLVELTAQKCADKKVKATVIHADNSGVAEELAAALKAAVPQIEIVPSEFGPVIATHVGPGAVGIIFTTY